MSRRQVGIAATPEAVEQHDVVVLHRVVCCYPDYELLLGAAADHATKVLVFSHPPRNLAARMIIRTQNLAFWMLGKSLRTFAHPPAAMVAVVEARDMRSNYTYRGTAWQVVDLTRTSPIHT